MAYRVCLSVQPGYIQIEETATWDGGQVHAKYPKLSGVAAEYLCNLILTSILRPAPNMSITSEPLSQAVGKDGLPTGCYASVHNNESDVSVMPVEYSIIDYEKVDPIQVFHEGSHSILSSYQVDDKPSIEYADLLKGSLKSFDSIIWSVSFLTFLTFSLLLCLRQSLKALKENYHPLFESFTHLIGQESTDYSDRSGRVISFTMTTGFFFILSFYLNLMSTDLVVVTKPEVINNYRDIMNANKTIGFLVVTHESQEFEEAEKGSIQEKLWKQFSKNHWLVDISSDVGAAVQFTSMVLNQKAVFILTSLFSPVAVEACCKFSQQVKDDLNNFNRTYSWTSSDPEGKQHTQGLIIRQGLDTDLIRKGKRRIKGLFEGDIIHKSVDLVGHAIEFGSFSDGNEVSFSALLKCMSKQVNYNQPEVEEVSVKNFKYLIQVCGILIAICCVVLVLELLYKTFKETRVTRL